jgi:ABC-type xylose transport system permease subunit
MCCAIVALAMTLLAGWRSVPQTLDGRGGRLRRVAIVVIAIGAAIGSATAADQFALAYHGQPSWLSRFGGMPICSEHFIR